MDPDGKPPSDEERIEQVEEYLRKTGTSLDEYEKEVMSVESEDEGTFTTASGVTMPMVQFESIPFKMRMQLYREADAKELGITPKELEESLEKARQTNTIQFSKKVTHRRILDELLRRGAAKKITPPKKRNGTSVTNAEMLAAVKKVLTSLQISLEHALEAIYLEDTPTYQKEDSAKIRRALRKSVFGNKYNKAQDPDLPQETSAVKKSEKLTKAEMDKLL